MECLLVVRESGQGECWVLERRFDGVAEIQGVVICDLERLVLADDEGEDAVFSTVPFGIEGGGNLGDCLN